MCQRPLLVRARVLERAPLPALAALEHDHEAARDGQAAAAQAAGEADAAAGEARARRLDRARRRHADRDVRARSRARRAAPLNTRRYARLGPAGTLIEKRPCRSVIAAPGRAPAWRPSSGPRGREDRLARKRCRRWRAKATAQLRLPAERDSHAAARGPCATAGPTLALVAERRVGLPANVAGVVPHRDAHVEPRRDALVERRAQLAVLERRVQRPVGLGAMSPDRHAVDATPEAGSFTLSTIFLPRARLSMALGGVPSTRIVRATARLVARRVLGHDAREVSAVGRANRHFEGRRCAGPRKERSGGSRRRLRRGECGPRGRDAPRGSPSCPRRRR